MIRWNMETSSAKALNTTQNSNRIRHFFISRGFPSEVPDRIKTSCVMSSDTRGYNSFKGSSFTFAGEREGPPAQHSIIAQLQPVRLLIPDLQQMCQCGC